MRIGLLLAAMVHAVCCQPSPSPVNAVPAAPLETFAQPTFDSGSWQHFLQTLPAAPGKVVDFTGIPVANQSRHMAVVNFDVGRRDLQQCADALIRLRAEYLFAQKRYDEIGFHFTSGHFYLWKDYCKGWRPVVQGNRVRLVLQSPCTESYGALRRYLDIVYAYAGTISLARELKPASGFEIGTVIIRPGSPGHCCMIVDERVNSQGKRVYKLVEGYTPAQSIYILKNGVDGSAWQELKKGEPVVTASYHFANYYLRRF